MKRRVMNALAGLSLILALATGGLWGRSYWVLDQLRHRDEHSNEQIIGSMSGQLYITLNGPDDVLPPLRGWWWQCLPNEKVTTPEFAYVTHYWNERDRVLFIHFPHWSLLLALAILPTLRGWQLLGARRRRSENLCPQCGYDLRATPQRCPECGHETELGARGILK